MSLAGKHQGNLSTVEWKVSKLKRKREKNEGKSLWNKRNI